MKIAFDENMPATIVRTFQTIGEDKGFRRLFKNRTIVSAKDYTPIPTDTDYSPKNDVPWLTRYRLDGGRVVISGNTKMPEVPHELLALRELGLVTFFLPPIWNNWRFPRKSALIFVWLERILLQAKVAKPGSLYRVPNDWRDDVVLMVINPPGALQLREPETPLKPRAPTSKPRREVLEAPQEPPLLGLMRRERDQTGT